MTCLFTPDKIKEAWLISNKTGNFEERDIIVQYEDQIVRQGITNDCFDMLT